MHNGLTFSVMALHHHTGNQNCHHMKSAVFAVIANIFVDESQSQANILNFIFILVSQDTIKKLWILGDNFTARTYRSHFKLNTGTTHYMKDMYEVTPYCNSRYNSANQNMLARIQNTLIAAISKNNHMPDYIVVVLDDDLITFLDYKSTAGLAEMLGKWVEWIILEISQVVTMRQ